MNSVGPASFHLQCELLKCRRINCDVPSSHTHTHRGCDAPAIYCASDIEEQPEFSENGCLKILELFDRCEQIVPMGLSRNRLNSEFAKWRCNFFSEYLPKIPSSIATADCAK